MDAVVKDARAGGAAARGAPGKKAGRPDPVPGRLVGHWLARPGFRPEWRCLVTTLTDTTLFPAAELVEKYGGRWQVELNRR